MKKYFAHYNVVNKEILGWYTDSLHEVIPTPNLAFTEEEWQLAIDGEHNKVDLSSKTTSLADLRSNEQKAQDLEKVSRGNKKKSVISATVALRGFVFQADEDSLNLMATTILALNDEESVSWRLEDNFSLLVTKEELREVLRLGILNRNTIMEDE